MSPPLHTDSVKEKKQELQRVTWKGRQQQEDLILTVVERGFGKNKLTEASASFVGTNDASRRQNVQITVLISVSYQCIYSNQRQECSTLKKKKYSLCLMRLIVLSFIDGCFVVVLASKFQQKGFFFFFILKATESTQMSDRPKRFSVPALNQTKQLRNPKETSNQAVSHLDGFVWT